MKNIFRNYKQVLNEYGQLEELEILYETLKEREKAINEIIESIGNPFRNLKVHDISGYLYELRGKGLLSYEEETNMFQWICEREYEYFEEIEKEKCYNIKREYIGRTSSFCYEMIDSLEILEFEEHNFEYQKIDIDESIGYYYLSDNFLMLLLGKLKNEDETTLEQLLIEAMKEMKKIYQIEADEVEDFEEMIMESVDNLQEIFERIEYDFEVIENALKNIEFMLSYIDGYKTEENEIEIAMDYVNTDIEFNQLRKINDIIEETKQNILSVIHNSKGKISLEDIHYYYDSVENAFMIEISYSDKKINSLENHDLTYTIDDIVNDKVIYAFHYDLLGKLIDLKLEFNY